jgi:hypothetical protein
MRVKETQPGKAISIVNADVIVDFEAPEGYVEPKYTPTPKTQDADIKV